uniref:Protein kinase domain-containing protein n=1 Tax=Branchiostoma floridae TaxID=7739 RepID=C3ZPZ7_BRAFL|eukprot:XP_002589365.1 hypothetical protein BRAFLDRAFT_77811 [Branchiostoma floridae]
MGTAAETGMERKLRERREKSARMQQQISQQKDQAVKKMDTSTDKDLSLAFSRLALKVKQAEWKHIARQLGFNNKEIKDVESPTRRGHEPEESGAAGGQMPDEVQSRQYIIFPSRYPSVTIDRRFPIVESGRLVEQSILGRGGFAYVKKARHRDWRQVVAVKCLLTREIEGSEQELLYSEARKLNLGSRSDHVISLLGVCLDPNFAIVMPYMENGSLAGLLRDVDVPWALRWRMAHEISLGMTFLHCQNPQILHCDLKAENVLLDGDFHVKISDFGLSKWKTESRIVTQTSPEGSTITHAPPEYFLDINLVPTPKFDVYSFAVLLWEIITRAEPYGNPPDMSTVSQLLQACWTQNPEDRPTFNDCADRLHHVKNRFSLEEILQAIGTVVKMKSSLPVNEQQKRATKYMGQFGELNSELTSDRNLQCARQFVTLTRSGGTEGEARELTIAAVS